MKEGVIYSLTATTHQLTGLLFGLLTVTIFNLFSLGTAFAGEMILFFILVLFGSLLPDLDTPKSKLGRRFPFYFLSYPLYWLFGHRTWTHSFMFVVIALIIGWIIGFFLGWEWYLSSALAIGVASHVAGDFFFDGGVPLFYPFQKRKYKFIVTARTKRPNEINISENVVMFFLVVLNLWLGSLQLDVLPYAFSFLEGGDA